MSSGEQPHHPSSEVFEAGITDSSDASQRKRSRTSGTDDGGYASATWANYAHLQPTADGDGNGNRNGNSGTKKRKTGAAGSRGVANLTPEQLEKKRANDREAQRAIRERTKAQIDSLQREIHELKSQQLYLELQAALHAKDAVEAELLDIKRRLTSVTAMMHPILSGPDQRHIYHSPGHTYILPAQRPAPPSINNASPPSTAGAPSPASIAPPPVVWHWQRHNSVGTRDMTDPSPPPAVGGQHQSQSQSDSQAKLLNHQRHELVHGLDLGAERLGLDFLLDYPTQRVPQIQNGVNGAQDSPQFRHVPMKHDWPTGAIQGPNQNNIPDTTYATFSSPLKNCPPTCPLDSLLLDFLHERHQRAVEGLSTQEIIGPRYPSVSSLLNPAASRFSHPLSKVFTDILHAFPDISALPERVAVLFVMFLIMRWQVSPTRENYDRLPDWARPLPPQRVVHHPAWMDMLPFPRMREKLVREYAPLAPASPPPPSASSPSSSSSSSSGGRHHEYCGAQQPRDNFPLDNFFIPYTTTLSLNWAYEDVDVLLQSPDSDELMINPVFERHLRRLENWTLGDAFAKAFPELAGTYNLKSEGGGGAIKLARQLPVRMVYGVFWRTGSLHF